MSIVVVKPQASAPGAVQLKIGPQGPPGPSGPSGGGGLPPADDIATSDAAHINRARGLRGIPLVGSDGVPPPVGGTWAYDAQGTAGFKPHKPVMPGHFCPDHYGAAGDGVTDDSDAFDRMFADIAVLVGSINTDSQSATIILSERKTYYLARSLVIDRNVHIKGAGGHAWIDQFSTRLSFAVGEGIWLRGISGLARPYAGGATLENFAVYCIRITAPTWQYGTAYSPGDLVYRPDDHEHVWECVGRADGTAGSGLSLARPQPAWTALTAYSPGDKVTPTQANGHTYTCTVGGTSGASEPPWFIGTTEVCSPVDGTVTWQESTRADFGATPPNHFSSAHFVSNQALSWSTDVALKPFKSATDPDVLWTTGHTYRYNDVVRVPGVTDTFFWIDDPSVNGAVAGATPPTSGTPGTTVSDGSLTWRRLLGSWYLATDNEVLWQPRRHSGISATTFVTCKGVHVTTSSNTAFHLMSSAVVPPLNVCDGWRLDQCSASGSHGFIRCRGGDASVGVAINCNTLSPYYDAVHPLEWDRGCEDIGQFGSTWISCLMQSMAGYSFVCGSQVSQAVFINCYQESFVPSAFQAGLILGGFLSEMPRTADSAAVVIAGGGSSNFKTTAKFGGGAHTVSQTLGGAASVDIGYAASMQADTESYPIGFGFADAYDLGIPAGWWTFAVAPSVFNAQKACFAASGDTATPLKDANFGAGQFMVASTSTQGLIIWGDPYAHFGSGGFNAIGPRPAMPTTGKWRAGDFVLNTDLVTYPNILGWQCIAGDDTTAGTWKAIGNNSASVAVSALDIDWSAGDVFTKTLAAGANTLTFSNDADAQTIRIAVTGAASTLTWPTVKWAGGVAPTQSASGTDLYELTKVGATIIGSVLAANVS